LALKSLALYRNRSLVPEAPGSFEAAIAAGRASGVRPLAWETGEFFYQAPFAHSFGAAVVSPEGEVRLDTPELGRSMDYVAGLLRDGDLPPEADGAKVSTLFNEGRVAFVLSGPWFLGDIRPGVGLRSQPAAAARGEWEAPRTLPDGRGAVCGGERGCSNPAASSGDRTPGG
jgi:arabinogalactan oligomer/maltooligosaccharide transport system permease protein